MKLVSALMLLAVCSAAQHLRSQRRLPEDGEGAFRSGETTSMNTSPYEDSGFDTKEAEPEPEPEKEDSGFDTNTSPEEDEKEDSGFDTKEAEPEPEPEKVKEAEGGKVGEGEACSTKTQCMVGLTCCNWNNAVGAADADGICGQMCTMGNPDTEEDEKEDKKEDEKEDEKEDPTMAHLAEIASGMAKACPKLNAYLEQTGGLFNEGERPVPNHDQMAAMCGEHNSHFHGEQNECVGFMQNNGMDPIKESDCMPFGLDSEKKEHDDQKCVKCGAGTVQKGDQCVGISATCAHLWGDQPAHFVRKHPCQCNSRCGEFGNCCPDYDPQHHEGFCSRMGCPDYYDRKWHCQCNHRCGEFKNCCDDAKTCDSGHISK